jgi:hypothetical protein
VPDHPGPEEPDWITDLTPAELEAISRHLAQCPLCQVAIRPGLPPEALLDGPPEDAEGMIREVVRRVREEAPVVIPVPRQRTPGDLGWD